jgi:hypothetical protein
MADLGARPLLQTCTLSRTRRFEACFTASRDAIYCASTRRKVPLVGVIDISSSKSKKRGARGCRQLPTWRKVEETDGKPSLRYITLLRDGARAHRLPEHYVYWAAEREVRVR